MRTARTRWGAELIWRKMMYYKGTVSSFEGAVTDSGFPYTHSVDISEYLKEKLEAIKVYQF